MSRVLLPLTGVKRIGSNRVVRFRDAFGLIGLWLPMLTPTCCALFMRRSFIMHHCFAVIWSFELNLCQIKFIKQ